MTLGPAARVRDRQQQIDYIHTVVAALQSARLSQQFTDVPTLVSHLRALCPHLHGGHYDGLRVHPRSGLPTLPEWARVHADQAIAAQALAADRPQHLAEPRRIELEYLGNLVDRPLAQLDRIQLDVRRIDTQSGQAHLRVRFDKLDGTGCFIRFALELSHRDPEVLRALEDDAGRADLVERLRALLYPLAELDAEWALVRLAEARAVTVERVEKGSVGPLWVGGHDRPQAWPWPGDTLEPGQCIASFGSDLAAVDVARDRDDDPFGLLLADRLSEDARRIYREARARLGYRVFKNRKFVASPALVGRLQGALRELGTRNLVYPLRSAP